MACRHWHPLNSLSDIGQRIRFVVQSLGRDSEMYDIRTQDQYEDRNGLCNRAIAWCPVCSIIISPSRDNVEEVAMEEHLHSAKHKACLAAHLGVHECVFHPAEWCFNCHGWFPQYGPTYASNYIHHLEACIRMSDGGAAPTSYETPILPWILPFSSTGLVREYVMGLAGDEVHRYYNVPPSSPGLDVLAEMEAFRQREHPVTSDHDINPDSNEYDSSDEEDEAGNSDFEFDSDGGVWTSHKDEEDSEEEYYASDEGEDESESD
ncbi:hypothetical protein EUX98_g1911 [Antrodiella citrinella]|uniref:Uncharacterized protein n=1 Tax=Antrodiella citrinella TaxID=2447956 RepID=A0A4S4N0D5_9APHY|nr:hypothetical protein EUX98_g1911 [Antrodiella citrinella]